MFLCLFSRRPANVNILVARYFPSIHPDAFFSAAQNHCRRACVQSQQTGGLRGQRERDRQM